MCRKLCEKPKDSKRICLTGMGGIGKTAILHQVINHFNRLKDKPKKPFDHIAFLTYNGSMTDSLMQITALGVQTVETIWPAMQSLCLEKKSVLLLIDDNRDNKQLHISKEQKDPTFNKLFTLAATVLFASRRPIFTEYFSEQRVAPLSVNDCIALFQNRCWGTKTEENPHPSLLPDDRKCLEDIIKERAGRNTKAVERLGAITKRNYNGSIQLLSKELKNKGFAICEGLDDEPLQEEFNKLYCFEDVKDEREADKKKSLLEAFALFSADVPLNQETCIKWMCEDAQIEQDNGLLLPLLNDLSESTWLKKQLDPKTETYVYSMHQVVKAAVPAKIPIAFDKHLELIKHLTTAISWGKVETFQKAQPHIGYAESLAEYFCERQVSNEVFGRLMFWLGRYFGVIADFVRALEWYGKVLFIQEKVLGKDHPTTAITYHTIAQVYIELGDFVGALVWCEKALVIQEKVLGKNHPLTALTYNNIALIHSRQGDYDEALEWYGKALVIQEKVLGKDHPDTANTYNSIAVIYYKQRDFDKALEWYEKALPICEKVLGKDHPRTAAVYDNIANVYAGQGDFVGALVWCEKALVIQEKVLGKDHQDTANTYSTIATICYHQRKHHKALEWYEKAISIFERVFGKEHPFSISISNSIELVYRSMG